MDTHRTNGRSAPSGEAFPPQPLIDRIRAREPLVGTVLGSPDALLAEVSAPAFDFVWLDLEHSPVSIRDVHQLAVAVQAAGCGCLVRLASPRTELLTAILDCGVDGVVVPRADDAEEVRRLVARLRYPPGGSRGFAHRRATGWGRRARAQDETSIACVVQIESQAALDAVDEIAAVPGVDALVVGTADLALDLGVSPGLDAAPLRAALRSVADAAAAADVASGIAAGGDPVAIAEQLGGGSLVVYAADLRIYAEAVDAAAGAMRTAIASRSEATR